ncbi:hypothetical protein ACFVMC_30285 [Nocardia sp. NPDC127579]|uniref:hypothetical protein n=1 Tax=Nocardia sp. NPDC127579 TaxID=3345402 RepID=UPI00363D692F
MSSRGIEAGEFGMLLVDRDPAVRRQAQGELRRIAEDDVTAHVRVAIEILDEDEYAYAWPDVIEVLRSLRYPWVEFRYFWQAFAHTEDDGFRDRIGGLLGLPARTRLPRFPPAAEREPGIQHWGWDPEGADARRCCHVAALVALLTSSTEWVRWEAFRNLAQGGPGMIGVLREVRASRSRARGAALALLAEFGWHYLDPADLAVVRRLIRTKQAAEVPEPVLLQRGWFALPTTDQAAVLDALGLCDPIPATLRMGFAAWRDHARDPKAECRRPINTTTDLYRYDDEWGVGYDYHEVFVTPAFDGWTLVVGDWRPRDGCSGRCVELSRRFGAAHFYEQVCDIDFSSEWCVAQDGEMRVHCVVFGDEIDFVQAAALGPAPTRESLSAWLEAEDHGRGHRTPRPSTLAAAAARDLARDVNTLRRRFGRDPLPDAALYVTTEESPQPEPAEWEVGVEGAAPRLSVLPETFGPHTHVVGTGVLAVPIAARHRVRMGAVLI